MMKAKQKQNIPTKAMMELLLSCTKQVYFIFNGGINIQLNSVVIVSLLRFLF